MRAKSMSMRSMGVTVIYLLLLGFGMTFLSGCGNSAPTVGTVDKSQDSTKPNGSQEQINVNQNALPATANVSSGDLDAAIKANNGWQLIDIRESREFAAGHIKMALNRPLGDLEKNLAQISKDKEIILIDLNGSRVQSAWHVLVANGYDQNKVKVLTGGMLQWRGIVSAAGSNSGGDNSKNSNNGGNNPASPQPKPEVTEVVGGC